MQELEIGIMFWAGRDPRETLRELKELGVRCGQLGLPGELDLAGQAEAWKAALAEEDFEIATVFCSYVGESYADIPTVERTVGFIPESTRTEREQRTKDASHFASEIGVKSIACHIGFVPHEPQHPQRVAVLETVRRICDHAAHHGQSFVLETGQEPADVLLNFLYEVERPNVGINFDPANLIMYGTGDPLQAVVVLAPHIVSVHCKDGVWPVKDVPGALGVEKALGEGAVGMEQFIAKLKQVGYKGILSIEREIEDQEQKKRDLRSAVELLQRLRTV
ncbi:MAG TPA: sugar phosphate isomerase/epimerase family protein [Bryobacteraceae bacterium]|nr:sugar phosphate isomerase/epimerase family protein [Bryobacteraceae bacterium]